MTLSNIKIIRDNKLIKSIGIYGFSSIIEKAFPFLCLPIFTRLLSVEDIGMYIFYISVYGLILPLSKLGLDNLIMINYYKFQDSKFKDFVIKATIIYFIWFILFTILSIFIGPSLMKLLSLPISVLYLALASSLPYYFVLLRMNLLRAKMKPKSFGKFVITISFFKYSLAIMFLFFFPNWIFIVYSTIVVNFTSAIFSIYSIIKEDKYVFVLNLNNSLKIIKESFAILIHQLNTWFGGAFSRVIITSKINLEATGGFGIASTFNTIMAMINESIDKAYVPMLFDNLKNHKINKKRIVKYSYLYYLIMIGLSALISIFGYYLIGFVFGTEYEKYANFIPFLVLTAMFNGFYKIHIAYVFFNKKLSYVTLTSFISNATSIALLFLLIDIYGLLGVTIALMIGQIIAYVLAFYFGNKYTRMPWFQF